MLQECIPRKINFSDEMFDLATKKYSYDQLAY